jgi:hypothetical protein
MIDGRGEFAGSREAPAVGVGQFRAWRQDRHRYQPIELQMRGPVHRPRRTPRHHRVDAAASDHRPKI